MSYDEKYNLFEDHKYPAVDDILKVGEFLYNNAPASFYAAFCRIAGVKEKILDDILEGRRSHGE